MDKSKIYLDLKKCTEDERKHVFSLLPDPILSDDYDIRGKYKYLLITDDYDNYRNKWYVDFCYDDRTEITYPEFIKLFEGGEKYDGWIKIESEADLPDEATLCWVFRSDKKVVEEVLMPRKGSRTVWWVKTATHYQPIIKPEPPKF